MSIERENAGYKIIESFTYHVNSEVGTQSDDYEPKAKEIVVGYKPKAPSEYVCWFCSDGNDYNFGVYTNSFEAAHEKAIERLTTETHMPYYYPKPHGEDEELQYEKSIPRAAENDDIEERLAENLTDEDWANLLDEDDLEM